MLRLTRQLLRSSPIVTALIVAACIDYPSQALPAGSIRFDAPPVYATWWKIIESCSGRSGSLGDLDWYVVPGARSIPDGSYGAVGAYTDLRQHRIVLAGEAQMVGSTVRHEMLHALNGAPGHPRRDFFERCGGAVQCSGLCQTDAGPAPTPDANAPRVPGDSFDVRITIEPRTPSSDTLGGYFMATVTAHNASSHAVVLAPNVASNPLPSYTFGFLFGAEGPNRGFIDNAWDSEVTSFAAGETKREIFDFVVGDQPGAWQLSPGTYQLRGNFGANVTAPITFTVAP
jgi:hypothetical protein